MTGNFDIALLTPGFRSVKTIKKNLPQRVDKSMLMRVIGKQITTILVSVMIHSRHELSRYSTVSYKI